MVKDFVVSPGFFRGNKKFGRTTKVTQTSTGFTEEFMGVVGKKRAIENFNYQRSKKR